MTWLSEAPTNCRGRPVIEGSLGGSALVTAYRLVLTDYFRATPANVL
jgi:hypothetical protein